MRYERRFSILPLTVPALVLVMTLGSASRALAAERPVAVSPGDTSRVAQVEARCPTFSWTAVPTASHYELVVYQLGDVEGDSEEVMRQRVPGGGTNWTPSLDRRLERGGQYAWSVRTVGDNSLGEWSVPSLFEVAPGPSEEEFEKALGVVRRYLAGQAPAPILAEAQPLRSEAVGSGAASRAITPPGSYALSIDGDFALGGDVFKEGVPFLHTDGGGGSGFGGYGGYGGYQNTAVGLNALVSLTLGAVNLNSGRGNTALGYRALYSNTTGYNNNASGSSALYSNVTGSYNTASGRAALRHNIEGNFNTAIGETALYRNVSHSNTASGSGALRSNTTGYFNTASGATSLRFNIDGNKNTASGSLALRSNTSGSNNAAFGHKAGFYATTGSDNVFIANVGAAGDDALIKMGTSGTHTKTYIAGIYVSPLTGGSNVVVTSDGQLGTGPADSFYGWERVDSDFVCDTGLICLVTATCPVGKNVLGGGLDLPSLVGSERATMNRSFPLSDTAWSVEATNVSGVSLTYRAWAICAPASI